jgi:hypothetical protein
MADDYTIRVDAGDLADIIADRQSARADYETCVRDATEAASQWREEIGELLTQFNQFRRAVQEATGLDQSELLHDDELVERVRARKERRGVSWTPPQYDDFQRTGFAKQHDTDETAAPVKQDVDPAWVDTAQQRVGEQLAGDGPPEGDHRTDAITYAKMIEREKATLADGSQARFYSDERPDDGPPTENMPAVEQPPAVPDDCKIGRIFTDDTEWERVDFMPIAVVNRAGDWWEYSHIPSGQSLLAAVYDCPERDITHSFAELLHMHGTLWEVLDTGEQPSVAEQAPADDEDEGPPAKPNLHVATLYTSQQDGGSRWYELSDGWVVCAHTLKDAMKYYPNAAVSLEGIRDAHQDLRNEGIATS